MQRPNGTAPAQPRPMVPEATREQPRPSEMTPPPMREVTKGWFSDRERLVPREEIEADERRK